MARFSTGKKQIAHSLVGNLPESRYQINPYFSDLLKQPDVLLIPRLGKMIVVFMYTSPKNISWHTALAWIEDLVEVKLNVGEYVITTALLFAELDEITITQDIKQLLSASFEGFYLPDEWKRPTSDSGLYEELASLEQKAALHNFLSQEREQVSATLERFNTERFARLVDKDRVPEHHPKELKLAVEERLPLPANSRLVQGILVPNIKGHFGNLGRRYAFEFNFGISGRNDVAIEVIRSGRYGSREKIRYLMMKGRMLRYMVDNGKLLPRNADFHPILIVDGNLSGPDHDPYRYVRALLSVGWDIAGMDELDLLGERLRHGYV